MTIDAVSSSSLLDSQSLAVANMRIDRLMAISNWLGAQQAGTTDDKSSDSSTFRRLNGSHPRTSSPG